MKSISINFDKLAMGLSLTCAVHCLLLPVTLVLLPALTVNTLGDEHFHQWMLIAVLPTSLFALTLGCRQHRNLSILAVGLIGLLILTLTTVFGHDLLGENGERVASLIGASFIAFSHFKNQALCRRIKCDCEKTHDDTNNR